MVLGGLWAVAALLFGLWLQVRSMTITPEFPSASAELVSRRRRRGCRSGPAGRRPEDLPPRLGGSLVL
jgi:hypothetical protein